MAAAIFNFLFIFLPIQTANLKMDLIILLNRIRHLFRKGALRKLSQIGGIVIFMAIQNMLEINGFIGYVQGNCDDGDEMMQLRGFVLS